jgi:hypothetical protein
MNESYAKVLTRNDTGETGGHQGGTLVPKSNRDLVAFFPELNPEEFNPEAWLSCIDPDGNLWEMRYVYYNGKAFTPPKSTRNEYRITYMTKFFAKWNAKADDSVVFTATGKENCYKICIEKNKVMPDVAVPNQKIVVLRGWTHVF